MNKMRQPLLFATGTFFAVMLAVFGTLDLAFYQESAKGPTGTTQSLPSVSAGQNSCYRVTAPALEGAEITSFKAETQVIELSYPIGIDEFISAAAELGFTVSYDPDHIPESNYSAVYLNKILEGTYQLDWKLESGINGSARFVEIPCVD